MLKVSLITKEGPIVRVELPEAFILDLVKSVCLNGEEMVITNRKAYNVTGLIFGEMKDKILLT
jgi:hypothetical protein